MKKKNFNIFFLILSIFSIDRLTKYLITNKLDDGINISITPFLSFNLIKNEGIAFGLFSFNETIYYNLLTIFILIIVIVILWMIIKSKGLENDSKNWQLIDPEYLDTIKDKKKILEIPSGSLVLWDSRTFHQNIVSDPNEERLVQYICMKPKNSRDNSSSQTKKRLKYFEELRTTSHWPYPIKVNSLQPRTYGNDQYLIDYSSLKKPNLDKYLNNIRKLI